jgi:polysaccharide biosynthesis/export protein
MIVGFTKEDRNCSGRNAGVNDHCVPAIRCWAAEIAGKAITSTPLARHSIWGHYRVFKTKRLVEQANGEEWDKSVPGFTKNGSYSMNRSLIMFVAMLLAIPAAGLAQKPQPPSAASASSVPPATDASQKKPATDSTDIAHYIIGPEDTLQITVWKEPTLSGTVPVRPDGRISLVLLGDLQAAGMTPMQLGDDITQRLKKYIQDPSVSVVVLAVNSQRIFIIGEVGHVGAIPMTAGMTPLQAIAAAGGLSPFANSKHIYILRAEGAKREKIPFNYKAALKGENKQDVSLQPGDTIVVP